MGLLLLVAPLLLRRQSVVLVLGGLRGVLETRGTELLYWGLDVPTIGQRALLLVLLLRWLELMLRRPLLDG